LQTPYTIADGHIGIARRLNSTVLIRQMESEYEEEDRLAVSLAMMKDQQDHRFIKEFEQAFAKFIGADLGVFTINRSSAISLALTSLGLKDGDEAIIPVCASLPLVKGVLSVGVIPRFVDVMREDGNIDPCQLRLQDASKVKALIAVHSNGRSCAIEPLLELASKNGWYVIEDASEAIGSRREGKHLGTFANLGLFAFQRSGLIGLENGAILVTSDDELFYRLMSSRDKIWDGDLTPSEVHAALALSQLRRLRGRIDRKRQVTRRYYELLEEAKLADLWRGRRNGELLFNIDLELPRPASPAMVKSALEKCGVQTKLPPPPLHHTLHVASTLCFPTADEYCAQGLLMPSSVSLEDDDLSYICEVLRLTLKSMLKPI